MRNSSRPAVALNILAEAARRGASQQDLATVLGLSPSAFSRRMAGEVEFRLDELKKVAAYLEVPLEQLLAEATGATA